MVAANTFDDAAAIYSAHYPRIAPEEIKRLSNGDINPNYTVLVKDDKTVINYNYSPNICTSSIGETLSRQPERESGLRK